MSYWWNNRRSMRRHYHADDNVLDSETGEPWSPDGGGMDEAAHDALDHTGVPGVGGGAAEDVSYSNAYIEDAGGSAADVKEALDFVLQALRDNSLIASTVLVWDGTVETDLTTPQGQTFTNATRSATGGPSNEAKVVANVHGDPVLQLSGITPGTRYRVTIMKRSSSGGGTYWNLVVQGGTTQIDTQSGTWLSAQATVTIGANGQFKLSASWSPEFAHLLIEDIGPA